MFRSRRGFSLVEMLVVISILTLLMSMLLPALTVAKEAARRVACASNHKQMSVAHIAWAEDHDGNMVGAQPSIGAINWGGQGHYAIFSRSWAGTYNGKSERMRTQWRDHISCDRPHNAAGSIVLRTTPIGVA